MKTTPKPIKKAAAPKVAPRPVAPRPPKKATTTVSVHFDGTGDFDGRIRPLMVPAGRADAPKPSPRWHWAPTNWLHSGTTDETQLQTLIEEVALNSGLHKDSAAWGDVANLVIGDADGPSVSVTVARLDHGILTGSAVLVDEGLVITGRYE